MKCDYCGAELSGKEVFCRFCGTRIVRKEPETEPMFAFEPLPEPAAQTVPDPGPIPRPVPAFDEENFSWQSSREEPEQQEFIPLAPEMESPEYNYPIPPMPKPFPDRPEPPRIQLPDRRNWVKMVFLGVLTLGIYPTVIWCRMVTELNIAASRYDGERTMPYFAAGMLTPITLGIYAFVWMHGLCRRVGSELNRRKLDYRFGAKDFWLWNVLGMLILVGPVVFIHKLTKSMNLINADFNIKG